MKQDLKDAIYTWREVSFTSIGPALPASTMPYQNRPQNSCNNLIFKIY